MKTVGDWVGLAPPGLSPPCGESAPPTTGSFGCTALTASYVRASSLPYAGAAASVPSGLNCGSQKRLMFGSLPTITPARFGYAPATDAV
jgi:hypothetical protein